MIARTLIAKAVANTRRMDGTYDSLAITRALMNSEVILGDEEHHGETRVIRGLDEAGWEAAHESTIVVCIAEALGYGEVTA
jgi:hypothetical protein